MQSATAMPARLLSILDFDHETLNACLDRAAQYKTARAAGARHDRPLDGRHVALLFEKPSLRTRSTFEIAVHELGGHVIEPSNNVATSLAQAAVMLGAHVRVASPEGFELPDAVVASVARIAVAGGSLERVTDPVAGVRHADAVYTDVWTSMGQEHEAEARFDVFAPYQVNAALMAHARRDALFMHCLPA